MAYSNPVLGVPPDLFFIKMTAKDVKEITLDVRSQFAQHFGAIGDKPLEGW